MKVSFIRVRMSVSGQSIIGMTLLINDLLRDLLRVETYVTLARRQRARQSNA